MKYVVAFLFRFSGAASTIIFTVVVSKLFDDSEAAKWFVVLNLITIGSVVVRWGVDDVIIKEISRVDGFGLKRIVFARLLFLSLRKISIISCVIMLFIIIADYFGYGYGEINFITALQILLCSVVLSMLMVIGRLYQGLGCLNVSAFILTVVMPMLCSFVVYIVAYGKYIIMDAIFLLNLYMLVAIITLFISYGLLKNIGIKSIIILRTTLARITALNTKKTDRDVLKTSNKLGFVVFLNQSLPWVSMVLVPLFFNNEEIKSYVVLQKISMVFSLVPVVINFALSPLISKLWFSRDMVRLKKVFYIGILANVLVASALILAAGLLGDYLISYMNLSSDKSMHMGKILFISQVVYGIMAFLSVFLVMSGNEEYLLKMSAIFSFAGIFLVVLACYRVDIVAVCLAFLLVYIFSIMSAGYRVAVIFSFRNG